MLATFSGLCLNEKRYHASVFFFRSGLDNQSGIMYNTPV